MHILKVAGERERGGGRERGGEREGERERERERERGGEEGGVVMLFERSKHSMYTFLH